MENILLGILCVIAVIYGFQFLIAFGYLLITKDTHRTNLLYIPVVGLGIIVYRAVPRISKSLH